MERVPGRTANCARRAFGWAPAVAAAAAAVWLATRVPQQRAPAQPGDGQAMGEVAAAVVGEGAEVARASRPLAAVEVPVAELAWWEPELELEPIEPSADEVPVEEMAGWIAGDTA